MKREKGNTEEGPEEATEVERWQRERREEEERRWVQYSQVV